MYQENRISCESACRMKHCVPYACNACSCQGTNFSVLSTCRNYEDAYSDPGSPVTRRTPQGSFVLAMVDDQKKLLMQGDCMPASGMCDIMYQFGAFCMQLLYLGDCLPQLACGMLLEGV